MDRSHIRFALALVLSSMSIAFAATPAFASGGTADLSASTYSHKAVGAGIVSAHGRGEALHLSSPIKWGGMFVTVKYRNASDHRIRLRIVGRRMSDGDRFYYSLKQPGQPDVTDAVIGTGYITQRLAPGEAARLSVRCCLAPGGLSFGFVKAYPVGGGAADAVLIRIGRR